MFNSTLDQIGDKQITFTPGDFTGNWVKYAGQNNVVTTEITSNIKDITLLE
jgi:hypothetical protein